MLIAAVVKQLYKLIVSLLQNRKQAQSGFSLNVTSAPAPMSAPEAITQNIPQVVAETPQTTESRYNLNDSLVTEAEQEFLKALEQAVGGRYRIVPQVPLSGIVKPKDSNYHYTNYHDFNRISAKKIDFVLYDKENWTPRLAIELDDRSHLRWDRMKRDVFVNELMEGVGLPILHVPTSYSYDQEGLRLEISEKIKAQFTVHSK